jgi:hypothetical protein
VRPIDWGELVRFTEALESAGPVCYDHNFNNFHSFGQKKSVKIEWVCGKLDYLDVTLSINVKKFYILRIHLATKVLPSCEKMMKFLQTNRLTMANRSISVG